MSIFRAFSDYTQAFARNLSKGYRPYRKLFHRPIKALENNPEVCTVIFKDSSLKKIFSKIDTAVDGLSFRFKAFFFLDDIDHSENK